MPMPVSGSYGRPTGCSSKAMGGAAEGMDISALRGESELVTVFDDFDDTMIVTDPGVVSNADTTINLWEECDWNLASIGTSSTNTVDMQDPNVTAKWHPSCMRFVTGDDEDTGVGMQLDMLANINHGVLLDVAGTDDIAISGHRNFQHVIIPDSAIGAAVLDDTTFVFACRVGIRADIDANGGGAWDSKAFIGWAESGDVDVLVLATGLVSVSGGTEGPVVGFNINEDGGIIGVSQATFGTALAAGTNFIQMVDAGGVDGTTANGSETAGDTTWFDLALRMDIGNISANAGTTKFYSRRVPLVSGAAGWSDADQSTANFNWTLNGTLTDAIPNNDVALVPTIEVINGPTTDVDGVIFLDWWTMGCSRISRL